MTKLLLISITSYVWLTYSNSTTEYYGNKTDQKIPPNCDTPTNDPIKAPDPPHKYFGMSNNLVIKVTKNSWVESTVPEKIIWKNVTALTPKINCYYLYFWDFPGATLIWVEGKICSFLKYFVHDRRSDHQNE